MSSPVSIARSVKRRPGRPCLLKEPHTVDMGESQDQLGKPGSAGSNAVILNVPAGVIKSSKNEPSAAVEDYGDFGS